jgi:hypothetical protein
VPLNSASVPRLGEWHTMGRIGGATTLIRDSEALVRVARIGTVRARS